MNWLRRFLVRLAVRVNPRLEKLLVSAGGSIERLSEEVTLLRERNSDRSLIVQREKADLAEAFAMSNGGPWAGRSLPLQESASPVAVKMKETMAELELALEDRGWKREVAYSQMEFSRYGIQQLILISRLYFIKNPLIRRGIQVSSHYVFGRGVEVSVKDDPKADVILQEFFHDPRNRAEISHRGLVLKEEALFTDGNIFYAFFTDPKDGSQIIRTIDPIEIQQIVCDPNDNAVPNWYLRQWSENVFDEKSGITTPKPRQGWYIAMGYEPKVIPAMIGGHPVMRTEQGAIIPVLHDKEGGLQKWHFGAPMCYAALDWARAYRYFLEDWCTMTRALARFSWNIETTGGPPAIAAFKQTLATTLGINTDMVEQNPPPVAASPFITGPGNKLTPIKTAGATTEPEQGRRVMLMVAAAFGLPETFFGDASTGSLATAVSLDRPTELKFLEAQERWREVLQRISYYVLSQSSKAPRGRLREAREADGQELDMKVVVEVKFPSVLEHDITSRVTAIVEAMTINGFECTGIDEKTGVALLLSELGVEDVQTVIDAMYPPDEYAPLINRTELMAANQDAALNPPDPTQPGDPKTVVQPSNNPDGSAQPHKPAPANPHPRRIRAKEAQLAKAIAELRRAAQKMEVRAGKV